MTGGWLKERQGAGFRVQGSGGTQQGAGKRGWRSAVSGQGMGSTGETVARVWVSVMEPEMVRARAEGAGGEA